MPYRAHTAVFSTGERFPVLLDDRLLPVRLPLYYTVATRRLRVQASTLARDVRILGYLYQWAEAQGLDLEARLRTGTLTAAEVTSVAAYLRSGRTKIAGVIGSPDLEEVTVLQPNTHSSYLSVIEDFLVWAIFQFQPLTTEPDTVRSRIVEAERRIHLAFDSVRSFAPSRVDSDSLTDAEVLAIEKVILPGDPSNPFKPSFQLRNWCIFELFLHTGIRRGELLKLALDDLPRGPDRSITIRRATNDPEDPRRNEPRVKTLARKVEIPRELALALARYEEHDRVRRKRSRTKYVFLSGRGGPLNYSGIHEMFLLLRRRRFPELADRLYPHALRHTCVTRWSRLCDQMGLGDVERRLVLTSRFGWVPHSSMPEHYSGSWVREMRDTVMREYQAHYATPPTT